MFNFWMMVVLFPLLLFSLDISAEEISVDNLQNSAVGQFPEGWVTYPFFSGKARRVYRVAENTGRKFIHAQDSGNISVPIFNDFAWDLAKFPYLKFSWRAQQLPAGAKEVGPATNDSACGVYVGFGRSSALKYVWSTSLPVGAYWEKNPSKFSIIVKSSGSENLNQWQTVTVNVPQDFKTYFHQNLAKTPSGIGILTDGNAVHQTSACDYADFRISSMP